MRPDRTRANFGPRDALEELRPHGTAGYVGSHTCKALARAGYRPVVLDNLSRGNRDAVRWGPLEEADLRDKAALDRIFAAYRPAAVIHLAAFAYVGESVAKPEIYYANNLIGMISLVEAMRRHCVANIVFSSTCAVYGNPIKLPLTEDHPKAPVKPYGFSKLACKRRCAGPAPRVVMSFISTTPSISTQGGLT